MSNKVDDFSSENDSGFYFLVLWAVCEISVCRIYDLNFFKIFYERNYSWRPDDGYMPRNELYKNN